MATNTSTYVPGVCNINREEIAYRRKAGHLGLTIAVVLLVGLIIIHGNRWFRIIEFFPVFLAAIGYLQAKYKFCVGYGAAGQQNAAEGSTKASIITDTVAVAKDKARAHRMNLQAAAIAVLITAIIVLLPV